jgi:ParB/RepB/Spo0J family partition protein
MEAHFATIKINEIYLKDRKRQEDSEKIKELSESISRIGLLNPISVSKDSGGYRLIAGLHRLSACKSLNWTEIPACVMELSGANSELAEIDENLIRCELHYLDRAEMLKRRQEIYEELYPSSKAEEKRKRKPSNYAEFCGDTMSPPINETESFAVFFFFI